MLKIVINSQLGRVLVRRFQWELVDYADTFVFFLGIEMECGFRIRETCPYDSA